MYYEPCSKIEFYNPNGTINIIIPGVNNVEISQSVNELGGSAKIVLPGNVRILERHEYLTERVNVGDKVKIYLGYDGNLKCEFSGYIREKDTNGSMKLVLDNELYATQKIKVIPKSFKNPTLKEILKHILPDYEIDTMEVNLKGVIPVSGSAYNALSEIQENLGFLTRLRDNKISCRWPYSIEGFGNKAQYVFYENVKNNGMKMKTEKDCKVRIEARAKTKTKTGKYLQVAVGASKNQATKIITRRYGWAIVENEEQLKEIAERELKTISYTGYTGTITGFGVPYVDAGDIIEVFDNIVKDRQAAYLVESINVRYNLQSGFERECTIGRKLYDII